MLLLLRLVSTVALDAQSLFLNVCQKCSSWLSDSVFGTVAQIPRERVVGHAQPNYYHTKKEEKKKKKQRGSNSDSHFVFQSLSVPASQGLGDVTHASIGCLFGPTAQNDSLLCCPFGWDHNSSAFPPEIPWTKTRLCQAEQTGHLSRVHKSIHSFSCKRWLSNRDLTFYNRKRQHFQSKAWAHNGYVLILLCILFFSVM